MARYAHEQGFRGELILEEQSRNTWENIGFALPYLAECERVKIVSVPFHAEKGRRYLHRRSPELAARLVPGGEYRFGEWMMAKPLLAAYGRWQDARDRRRLRRGSQVGPPRPSC